MKKSPLNPNIIALQKGLVLPPDDSADNRIYTATMQANLMSLGYILDEECFDKVSRADLSWISQFHNDVVTHIKEVIGGKFSYKPLYQNFPTEVMEKSDYQILRDQILHYISNGSWSPNPPEMERPVAFEKIKYIVLRACTEEDFDQIFTNLVRINTSLTPQDHEVIKWFAASGRGLKFSETIPFKENLCTLAAMGLDVPIKSVTDVLRIAIHMSGGDISLPPLPPKKIRTSRWSSKMTNNPAREKFKFKKFKRADRVKILSLLEKTNCDPREMVLKAQRWIRLGEIIHPGEYKDQFPKSYKAFHEIRNSKVRSWYSQVNVAFSKSLESGLDVLAQRGGEFVRRMDYLVRSNPGKESLVLDAFAEVCKKSSNKVLFEAYTHFEKRLDPVKGRSIMIKGARKKTYLPDLPAIDPVIVEAIHSVIFSALKEKFATLPELGNVWIDETLKMVSLPTNMRSMSKSQKPMVRGQRIPFDNPDAKVIRAYVHWMDPNGSEDIDLSATYSTKKGEIQIQNFFHQRFLNNLHSGDVRHRRGACAEYIDVEIESTLKQGYRWVILDARDFNGRGLEEIQSVFGIMEREFPKANKTWKPDTIVNAFKLTSKSVCTRVALLDLKERNWILLDLDAEEMVARAGDKEILKIIDEFSEPPKVSVYDLLVMHAEARGRVVTLDHQVDTFFRVEDFTHSYEKISEMMGI